MRMIESLCASPQCRRLTCLVAAVLVLGAGLARAEAPLWKERGYGGGGRFTAVAVNPADPRQIFIGSDVAGFYRSDDGGQSFKNLGKGLEGLAMAGIAVDPGAPDRVFLLTDDGLYLSEDSGQTQTRITTKVRYASRFFGSSLMVLHKGDWYAAADSDGVLRVRRQPNASWTATPIFGLEGKKVNALASFADKLWAATDEGVYMHDGEIWKGVNDAFAPNRRDIVDMAAHPSGRLYVLEKSTGLYALNDRARQFERRGPNLASLPSQSGKQSFKSLAVAPDNPEVVFLGTHPSSWPHLLLRSQDGGRTFSLVKRFTLSGEVQNWATDLESLEQLAFTPDGRTAFLLDWWNVWRSADSGASWLQVHKGLQNTVINDAVGDPAKPQRLYLAADDNGLMVSDDGGKTWRRKMAGVIEGHAAAVRVSARAPGLVYLLVNPWQTQDTADAKYFHLYKSHDGGETWALHRIRDKKKTLDKPFADSRATGLTVDPADENVVYVATNGYGVYRVETSGQPPQGDARATSLTSTLPTPFFKGRGAFLITSRDPNLLLAATLEGGIFRSEDRGATWRLVAAPKAFVFDLAQDPSDPKVFYAAAAEKRLLKSVDNGLTWQWINLPGHRPANIATTAVAVADGLVWAGTSGYNLRAGDGLYVSRDGGANFLKVACDLPRAGINVLVPVRTGSGPAVLVGFNGLGVHEADAPATGD